MKTYIFILSSIICLLACSRENEDVIAPVLSENYPQIILFDDEGGGELEDSDEISIVITLADRFDASGEELGGAIVPLEEEVTLAFSIADTEGIDNLADFIIGAEAFYEIDDCTTSLDEDNDLVLAYDPASGEGQLRFPAGVEEVELVLILDEDYFADDQLNAFRGLNVLLSLDTQEGLQLLDVPFEYEVLDDEAVFGEWTLDLSQEGNFQSFQELFGLVSPEISTLSVNDIEEVIAEFAYDEIKIEVVLTETEELEDCGELEEENLSIELEASYEELSRDSQEGDLEVEGSVEQENGAEVDFIYSGDFVINGESLLLHLSGEYDETETDEYSILFVR